MIGDVPKAGPNGDPILDGKTIAEAAGSTTDRDVPAEDTMIGRLDSRISEVVLGAETVTMNGSPMVVIRVTTMTTDSIGTATAKTVGRQDPALQSRAARNLMGCIASRARAATMQVVSKSRTELRRKAEKSDNR
jgi:hypothetical protein